MTVIIHHKPDCGTSRNTLALIRASGEEPVIIDDIREGWTQPQLLALFAGAGLTPGSALRKSHSPAEEPGLTVPSVDDETILAAMLVHPVWVNRPIMVTQKAIRLCRSPEFALAPL